MMRSIIPCFLLFICSAPAFGMERLCADPADLMKRTEDCGDNEVYSEAAILCLEGLEKEIKKATGALQAGLEGSAALAAQSQSGKQDNSFIDYKLSKETLNSLIEAAKASQEETGEFFDSVIWPEDFDNPEITGPDFDAFLNSDPCYRDNRDLIANVLADFDVYIAQLEEARDAAEKLEKTSEKRKSSLKSAGGTERAKAGPVKATPVKKKPGKRKSDISGTEEKEKK